MIEKRTIETFAIHVERVRVLHYESAQTHQAGFWSWLVTKLDLNLIPNLRQLLVRSDFVAGDRGKDFFVRHAETHVRAFAILQTEHVIADRAPTPRLLPDLRRMQRRQIELLPANAVHFFAQNLHYFQGDALSERQIGIDSRGKLAHDAGAQKEFMRNDFGISRVFAKSRNKIF